VIAVSLAVYRQRNIHCASLMRAFPIATLLLVAITFRRTSHECGQIRNYRSR